MPEPSQFNIFTVYGPLGLFLGLALWAYWTERSQRIADQKEFTAALIAFTKENMTVTNSNTRSNEALVAAVGSYNQSLKDVEDTLKDLARSKA